MFVSRSILTFVQLLHKSVYTCNLAKWIECSTNDFISSCLSASIYLYSPICWSDSFVPICSLYSVIKNKSGDTSDKNNYRPIVLVTAASKLFEICILEILETFKAFVDHSAHVYLSELVKKKSCPTNTRSANDDLLLIIPPLSKNCSNTIFEGFLILHRLL